MLTFRKWHPACSCPRPYLGCVKEADQGVAGLPQGRGQPMSLEEEDVNRHEVGSVHVNHQVPVGAVSEINSRGERMKRSAVLLAVIVAGVVWSTVTTPASAVPCSGVSFGAPFAGSDACSDLGTPTGVPGLLGGITFLDSSTLLIGGNANNSGGVIDQIGVTRGTGNHITGFSGSATLFSTAPFIDG